MSWPRYAQMEASGVAWLGEVPGHWHVKRLKRVVHVSGGMTPDKSEPDFWDGDMPWVTAKDMKSLRLADSEDHVSLSALRATGLTPVTPPASLIVVRGMILAHTFPVAEIDAPVTINQDMKALRPVAELAPGYLAWMLRGSSGYVLSIADESAHGTKALRTDRLFEMQIPLPPADEQRAIAAFLDRETARIDALVAAKRRLIALLQEKRAALIARAVTRGLDPDVPTKDSGVAWLGRVPAHWRVLPLKRVVATPITDGPHESPEFVDVGVPFVSAEACSSGLIDFGRCRGQISEVDDELYSRKYRPQRNDIFIVKSGATTGVAAIVETDERFNIWSPLAAIRCAPDFVPRFVLHAVRSREFQDSIALHWSMGTQQNIGMTALGDLKIPAPPKSEQVKIAAWLDVEIERIDREIQLCDRSVSLTIEHRSALITSAVTGRIDVRAAA